MLFRLCARDLQILVSGLIFCIDLKTILILWKRRDINHINLRYSAIPFSDRFTSLLYTHLPGMVSAAKPVRARPVKHASTNAHQPTTHNESHVPPVRRDVTDACVCKRCECVYGCVRVWFRGGVGALKGDRIRWRWHSRACCGWFWMAERMRSVRDWVELWRVYRSALIEQSYGMWNNHTSYYVLCWFWIPKPFGIN